MTKNPLFEAMTSKPKLTRPDVRPLDMPRIFDFKSSETGEVMPGDPIAIKIAGIVKSIDDKGNVSVNIVTAQNCDKEEDDEEEKTKFVMTQESHVP